jgi:hypothetical protein
MTAFRRGTRSSPDLFPQALQFAIDEQLREARAVANNPAPPTFQNTIEAMEKGASGSTACCRCSG